jgi:phosphoribosylformimino-5-aminoimidazole carboxamide ribotide isomerase
MGFEIIPAIDLRGGRVVRLRQGDFARETSFPIDPGPAARGFVDTGAAWIHVVDLDGARAGHPVQWAAMTEVLAATAGSARCQVAGGLRTAEAVAVALAVGAARVVVGTAAVADPAFAGALLATHGAERIVVALDVRGGLALGEGWRAGATGPAADDALRMLAAVGVTTFAVTAIERDGLLEGPDLALLERLVRLAATEVGTVGTPGAVAEVIASGGVSSLNDIRAVKGLGCAGAIVGRALYEGRLDLAEALSVARGPA